MIKFVLFTVLVACEANVVPTPAPVYCGTTPNNIFTCLGSPKIIKPEVSAQCDKTSDECTRMTCLFRQSGWLDGNKIEKQKTKDYFDQFAKDHPEWSTAVQYVKAYCLSIDLPAQGVHVNCPAYDVMTCALTGFLRNAPANQWSSAAGCDYAKQFAASCPVCPESCFAPAIPIGSCNACLALPRSP